MDFTNPLVYGAPAFIAFILLELTYSKTHGDDDLYDWKHFAVLVAHHYLLLKYLNACKKYQYAI